MTIRSTETIPVYLDTLQLNASQFQHEQVSHSIQDKSRHLLSFDFVITGNQEYHDVTSHLYGQTFDVKVPSHDLHFKGSIHNYSTSVPKLTTEEDTVNVHLELIEIQE